MAAFDPAKGEAPYASAELLPGRRHILAAALPASGGYRPGMTRGLDIVAVDVKSGSRTPLLQNVGETRFAPTGSEPGVGHLISATDSGLLAAPFDARSLEVGPAVRVFEWQGRVDGRVGFSHAGTLVYRSVPGDVGDVTFVWVDRKGNEQSLDIAPGSYSSPRLSPDGERVAVAVRTGSGPILESDLFVYELTRPARAKVTFGGQNTAPLWLGDDRLIYRHADVAPNAAFEAATHAVAADGSSPTTLWTGTAVPYSVSRERVIIASTPPFNSFSADASTAPRGDGRGRRATGAGAERAGGPGSVDIRGRGRGFRNSNQLWVVPLGADGATAGEARRFLDARFFHANAAFSPDGKWIAFQSNQIQVDQFEIYVVPYPAGTPIIPVSNGGGDEPRWNSNGRELFYRSGDMIMVADVATSPTFRVLGTPRALFEKAAQGYDVHPNGQRFLMLKPVPRDSRPSDLHVILNWFDELRRLAPLPD